MDLSEFESTATPIEKLPLMAASKFSFVCPEGEWDQGGWGRQCGIPCPKVLSTNGLT
jgi:hypothetical protein